MNQKSVMPYTRGPASVADEFENLPRAARQALSDRLDVLVATLTGAGSLPPLEALDVVASEVGHAPDLLWLAYSVLAAELPTDEDMSDLLVRARLGGTWAALAPVFTILDESDSFREVEVLRGVVTCDVQTTSEQTFLSGIQRVVRETTSRWNATHDVRFVGWTSDLTGLRHLRDEDHLRVFGQPGRAGNAVSTTAMVVPWECTHLWVEVITELRRTSRLLALSQHSRNEVGVLGYDSIPITSSATVPKNMTSHFARGLAAVRRADRVAMISAAAAEEFRGVMDMGAGRREPAPEIAGVPLAVESRNPSEEDLAEARAGLVIDGVPMVLVVGSHEPRKNHLAVLHAAERLWRKGLWFNLVLVGAGAWGGSEYERVVTSLIRAGRPVQSIRGLPDRLLWAAYQLAHCTVFPSLNEGFGLPVAESLAAGTPVVTSGFGSTRDIVAPHGVPLGGLFVDPRVDDSLTDALQTMLTDPETYERLRAETSEHLTRTWDDYAEELWSFLVAGVAPSSDRTHH
jgi:glycosyltransferase involved in cell wall biosynthesis